MILIVDIPYVTRSDQEQRDDVNKRKISYLEMNNMVFSMKVALKIQVFLLLLFLTSTIHARQIRKDSIDLINYNSICEAQVQTFDQNQLKKASYFTKLYFRKAKKKASLSLDSTIDISRYLKYGPKYLENAYFLLTGIYCGHKDLKNALDNYVLTLDVAENEANGFMIAVCKKWVGPLFEAERMEQEALILQNNGSQFYGTVQNKSKSSMKLTGLDSIHFNDYNTVVHAQDVKYDDKQLKVTTRSIQKLIYYIGGAVVIIVIIIYYFHQRQFKISQQFKEIISTAVHELKRVDQKKAAIDISPVIVDSVLENLDIFEFNREYLQPNINAYELSKIANVNKKYLVKVLKYTKEKGIITYINDLRVTHAMDRLKTDPSFQKYTIKAISEEVGFSNPKSFNKSFDRVFKISVKNFIDELKIEVNSQN